VEESEVSYPAPRKDKIIFEENVFFLAFSCYFASNRSMHLPKLYENHSSTTHY